MKLKIEKKKLESRKFDVAIIGYGPVGAMAALLFAEAGLEVVVIERGTNVYPLPRAVNLDGEVIRAFQQIGRGEIVDAMMQTLRPGDRVGFANSKREWLFGQNSSAFGVNGWQPANMFDQPEFEHYLRGENKHHPCITTYLGCQVQGIVNITGGVNLDVHLVHLDEQQAENQQPESFILSATYALGCDGASSFVRKHFDIGWHDLGYDHDWLVVDVTVTEEATLNNDTIQVCDPERIVTYVCTKDPFRRWEFKLNEGETWEEMLKVETIQKLIDPWTPRNTYEIRRAAVYQFHAATADVWRVGNVFIAGDAAHQTPPFLGQGLNAGMRDVINLAWKFPLVVNKIAKTDLLDSYEKERNTHARDLVDWAVSIGRLMDHMAEVEHAERIGMPVPNAPAAIQSSAYGQGREAPPIRNGVLCLEQVNDMGSTGYLFSQPLVTNKNGVEFLLDELLGPGFVLVALKQDAIDLSRSSIETLDLIGATIVCLEGIKIVRGHFDSLFKKSDIAIIRPDRVVFGHTTPELSADELVSRLAAKLTLKIKGELE